jgi:FMN phosphatase YigB (HAD superfamily)
MDGVVLHQPRVLTRVVHRVNAFVQKVVPNVKDTMQANDVNRMLYSTFGHTHIGIRTLYGKNAPSIHEFNEFVYNTDMLQYLSIHNDDEEFQNNGSKVRTLLEYARTCDIPCYIFSNAPDAWCDRVLEMLMFDHFIGPMNRLTSDHPVFQDHLLKPDAMLYKNVATFIQQTQQNEDVELVFVDDSLNNVIPAIGDHIWKPVLLKNLPCRLASPHVHFVSDIRETTKFL